MKVEVLVHKMPYGCKYYVHGETFEMEDNAATRVLVKTGRVRVVNEDVSDSDGDDSKESKKKSSKKKSSKYKTKQLKAED